MKRFRICCLLLGRIYNCPVGQGKVPYEGAQKGVQYVGLPQEKEKDLDHMIYA